MNRRETLRIKIGNIYIGASSHVVIQSMSTKLPSNTSEAIKESKRLIKAGCEIIRFAVKTNEDAVAFRELKKALNVPLVADIHFDYKLGVEAIRAGVDAIRFNPGNIGKDSNLKALVDECIKYNIPVRIGVNSGSINPKFLNSNLSMVDKAVESLKYYVKLSEEYGLKNIVLSIKMSNVNDTIEAYEKISKLFSYPLHLGLTEAGFGEDAIIKSTSALSILLNKGIGDTIRVSLTGDPVKEVKVAKKILSSLNLIDAPDLISCPTCGRTEVNLESYAKKVSNMLKKVNKKLTVAVMGCVVNGPGEAREADLGVAFIFKEGVVFKKGNVIFKGTPDEALDRLKKEIELF